jgi:hypothetical protein
MQISPLGEGDQPVGHAAKVLRLRQRGHDLLVLDQARGKAGEQRRAMTRGAVELTACVAVAHVK